MLKHFDQSQELQTMAKKCSQFYTIRTYDFCYLDSDEILLSGSWIEKKGLTYMLLCEDFVKFDV